MSTRWHLFSERDLMIRTKTLAQIRDWVGEVYGAQPVRSRDGEMHVGHHFVGMVYDTQQAEQEGLDPGVVPVFPTRLAPQYQLSTQDRKTVREIAFRPDLAITTCYGRHVPLILGLGSMGWSHTQIARTLHTSQDYVRAVRNDPKAYLWQKGDS
jgi:hypothetical protein